MRTSGVVVLLVGLAGCVTSPASVDPAPAPAGPYVISVLEGTTEPSELLAPSFKLLGTVGRTGPFAGYLPRYAGEPSIWAHLDGTIYLSYPGCDQTADSPTGQIPACRNGIVLRSDDRGANWKRLNGATDSKLTEDGPDANGDAEITVDSAGTVYASNLGGGIQVWRSKDRGESWAFVGNTTPAKHWADRQWMAAGSPGHLIVTWMGGKASGKPARALAINTTFDGGETWTGLTYVDDRIAVLGPVVIALDDKAAVIPFTKQLKAPAAGSPGEFTIRLARSFDGGRNWSDVDTKLKILTSTSGGHWAGTTIFPVMDVTGDGTLVLAWSEEVTDPVGYYGLGARVMLTTSPDWGTTWTTPVVVSEGQAAIMPAIAGGAGDRVFVAYYASDVPGPTDSVGRWDVDAAVVDGAAGGQPRIVRTVIDRDVHLNGICSRGSGCGAPFSDRTLLDFFEADVMPDGNIVLTYSADPIPDGKYAQVRAAIQESGTPLLMRQT